MKRAGFVLLIILIAGNLACRKEPIEASFEEAESNSLFDYLILHKDEYSSFISILEKGNIDKTLSAYNPIGNGYTLFLPNNDAINQFIGASSQFSSLEELLNNQEYVEVFSRYHVINSEINSNEFPFGAFPEPTLSGDFLTVSFIIAEDTSYYKINNQAVITKPNIELSNGIIHHVGSALVPVTFTS
jgi:uncharacterized surface protein with fasciclin (FAS1) repeats